MEKENYNADKMDFSGKTVVGFNCMVILKGISKNLEVMARVDTGAETSSIDMKLAAELNLGPILETRFIKSASGQSVRPLISSKIIIHGKEIEANFTIANRTNLKFPVLIGRNILKKGFIIVPDLKN